MNKEFWIEVRERFIEKHDREPTDSEMEDEFRKACGDQIDQAIDEMKMKRDRF